MRRVVITGIGVVSPLGNNTVDFWDGVSNGRSGMRKIIRADMSGIRFKNGGELRDFDASQYFDDRSLIRGSMSSACPDRCRPGSFGRCGN